MQQMPFALIALVALCLATAACAGSQYRVNADGVLERVGPEEARERFQDSLAEELQTAIGPAWVPIVQIEPAPYYEANKQMMGDYWQWDQATVAVRVVGDGSQRPDSIQRAELVRLVRSALRTRVHGRLDVQTAVIAADPDTVAGLRAQQQPAAAPQDEDSPAPATGPQQRDEPVRYVIQTGDTLAIISTVFYGSAEHWRRIVAANPDLDPDRPLPVGEPITIP